MGIEKIDARNPASQSLGYVAKGPMLLTDGTGPPSEMIKMAVPLSKRDTECLHVAWAPDLM
ncbi:hypothetical protein AGR7C_Lc120058 [Agrobacterium deltaense Zutra 3/1]|uniref:Uncharacterized protein n=1 Tax=Agrobacterium deltaense Zutra 3/1 TaxID=1183427 RepID=A0A1S7R2I9_9HYPH|nr:hypothetical protein AGR7C_Lc120058 [Agrobacterium deltaense Zutra 3/1]